MKHRYTIRFAGKTDSIAVTVAYGDDGGLRSVAFEDKEITVQARLWCYERIPMTDADMDSKPGIYTVEAIPEDLSFNVFWEAYHHKIGDKTRAMKLWVALVDADRVKCLRAIPKYDQWLMQRPSMERLYPETFLKQRRFDNLFKV
jgi:hypothetical protein